MIRRRLSKPQAAIGVILLAASGAVAFLGTTLWKASRSLNDATAHVARQGVVRFSTITLDHPSSAGFESISSPAQFRDAALFNGRFYLCGSAGMLVYDANGSLNARYRPGIELPGAPLVAMAIGVAAGSSERQLWIATSGEGLIAFDGRKFVQIRPEEEPARKLTALLPVASGRVLLGTEKNGVLAWDGQTLTDAHPALSELKITALAGSESDLWIGTIDRGAFRWHAGQLEHFGEQDGVPDPRVLSLAVHENSAYVGTALGVAEFRDGRFTRSLAAGFFAMALLIDGDSLVVGTLDEGVLNISLTAQSPRLRETAVRGDLEAVERLWTIENRTYAIAAGGLYERTAGRGEFRKVFENPNAVLRDSNISALAADRGGKLWVGYFDRGLDILEPGFERSLHVENEHVFCINRIVHHPNGGLSAVATANGLALFDANGHQKQLLGKREGLIADQVTDVLLAGDNHSSRITVATPAGLTTIDASGTSSLYAFHGLVNNHVYALAASGSRLLAGTLGGLSILDSGIVSANFTNANSALKHNWITAIVPVANDWFVGTYGAGVLKFDSSGRWSTFADWRTPDEINLNAMLATDRAVYAGTLGKGLAIYHRASGRWTFRTAGLPSLNVTALAAGDGFLYAGTDNGLVRIAEKELAR